MENEEKEVVTKEMIGLTDEIESDLKRVNKKNIKFIKNPFNVLHFTHKWRMLHSYQRILINLKNKILKSQFSDETLNETLCGDMWSNIFKTANDMINIAKHGSLFLMKKAHENGCLWDKKLCVYLASCGKLEMLKYAHENGCVWNHLTCSAAAKNGQLECLIYAHENECPWTESTYKEAVINNHFDCFVYAHKNGCKITSTIFNVAAEHGRLEFMKYLRENKCKRTVRKG